MAVMSATLENSLRLLIISSPASAIAILLALTARHSGKQRMQAAAVACTVAVAILLCVALTGPLVFEFFGISLQAFKIAGGLFLVYIGLVTVFGGDSDDDSTQSQSTAAPPDVFSFAITPLGVPLICGPGMISTVLLLGVDLPGFSGRSSLCLSVIFSMAALFASLWLCAKYSSKIPQFALMLATKLTGVFIVALGVLICCGGLAVFLARGPAL
jgi:multiple antibiotic resistance protein